MIIEISQDDILKNVGTENLFEKNNYSLNEETDIILNGDFDGDVIYDFFDYLKKKACRINSITAPRVEVLPQTFFCGVKMVKKIIIQKGTEYLETDALGACDIETLVLPHSLGRYVSGVLVTGNPLRESKIRNIEFSGGTNKNEVFKDFLSEVLSTTLWFLETKNIGKYSFEIREVNITEEFESLVDHEGSSGKINSEDKVYSSMLNGERLFLFTDKWFDNLGLIRHDQQYDLAYLHDLKYFTTVLAVNFEKAFIRVSCRQNQDSGKKILSNKKSTSFIGQNSIYLKTDDMKQMGYFAKFEIRSNANVYTDPFQIWISGKLMEQINLEPLQILRLSNEPDIFDMTPEEYEQFQKYAAERIKEIEKKALKRLRNPRRGAFRAYIEE